MLATLALTLALAAPPALKVKVDGDGYLRFAHQGRVVYSSSASLVVVDGSLAHSSGAQLLPPVRVPGNASVLEIDLEGRVITTTPSGKAEIGRLVLAVFEPGQTPVSSGAFLVSSTRPKLASPGDGTAGVIRVEGAGRAVAQSVKAPAAPLKKAVAKSGQATIAVAEESEAAGDKILLGEIAQVEASAELAAALQAIEIGDTPVIGVTRGLTAGQIQAKLKLSGYDLNKISLQVPANAKVRRRSQIVTPEAFQNAALEAAKKTLGESVPLMAAVAQTEFRAPMGSLEVVAESCTANTNGASVIVVVRVDGKRYNSRQIQVKPEQAAVGVRIGSAIKILVASGGAVVELIGQAKGNAFVGQTVAVKTSTGVEMTGVVRSADRVEVKL